MMTSNPRRREQQVLRLLLSLALLLSSAQALFLPATPVLAASNLAPDAQLSNLVTAADAPVTSTVGAQTADASLRPANNAMPLQAPSIAVTKRDSLLTDLDSDGNVDPGDTVRYTIIVTNSGTTDATGVALNDTADANTTLVPNSVKASPIAVNDSYNAVGNVRIQPNAAQGLLANDNDPDGSTLTASGPTTSANGGNVVVNANGSFSYDPPPGFTGTDTFTYTASDGTGSDTATVTITVGGMIWFVNDDDPTPGGDGRLTNPFNCLVGTGCFDQAAADEAGDNIFLYSGNYTGGLTLLNTQRLLGQGASASLASMTATSPPSYSDPLPATNGTAPVITTTSAGTNGVNLGSGNTVRGLTIGNTTGTDIAGTSFGTLTVADTTLNGNGRALGLTTGTLDATFIDIMVSATALDGVRLQSIAGTLTVSGATNIQNPGGTGILITGSNSVTTNWGSTTVNKGSSAGDGVNIASTGTTTFSSVSVTTSNGGGYLATGGTHNVTTGSITATGGPAVSISTATLGLTFTSLSSTDSTGKGVELNGTTGSVSVSTTTVTNPSNIGLHLLNNTNTTAGTFSFGNANITGSGSTGVRLETNAKAISFADLDISPDSGQRALHATNSTGALTATSGTLSTTNAIAVEITGTNAANKTPINLQLTTVSANGGTNGIVLANTSTTGSPGGFRVLGNGGTCTIATPTCTGGLIENTSSDGIALTEAGTVQFTRIRVRTSGRHGINGTGSIALTFTASYLQGNGNGDDENSINLVNAIGSATLDATQFLGAAENLVRVSNNNANLTLTVQNSSHFEYPNPKNSAFANSAILVQIQGSSVVNASIQGNTFKNIPNNSLNFGGDASATGTSTATFSTNTVSVDTGLNTLCSSNPECRVGHMSVGGSGGTIQFVASSNSFTRVNGDGVFIMGSNQASTLRARVQNNTISNALDDAFVIGLGQNSRSFIEISGNNVSNLGGDAIEVASGETDAAFGSGSQSDMDLVITNNTFNNVGTNSSFAATGGPGIFRFGDADQELCLAFTGNTITNVGAGFFNVYLDGNFGGLGGAMRYEATGSGALTEAKLQADNPGTVINSSTVVISAVNLSNGATCQRSGLSALGAPASLATVITGSPALQAVIVVPTTVDAPVMSQISTESGSTPNRPTLRTPRTGLAAPLAADPVSLTVGTLPAGKRVIITFDVTVNNPVSAGTTQISNQAFVSGTNFTTVPSNDPDTPTASDPTITPIQTTQSLALSKSDGGITATPGSTIAYTLRYTNTGNVDLDNVTLSDVVPANTTFNAGASSGTWSCANGAVAGTTCTRNVGTVNGGNASSTATFAVTVVPFVSAGTTQITNNATVSSGVSASASDTTPVTTNAAITLSKSDGGITATPGSTIPYTLRYTNTGNIELSGVILNETVPANTTFNSGASTGTWSCANGAAAGTSCTSSVGTLGGTPGSRIFAVTVITPVPAGTTTITNSASVTTSGSASANASDTTPLVTTPGLALSKSDGGASAAPGGTIAYTLRYTNTGNIGLTSTVLTDTVPLNTTFNAASSSIGWNCVGITAGSTCTFSVGILTGGQNGSQTFAVTVNALLPAGTTTITNTAQVGSGPTVATASDTTPLTTAPGLSLTKNDGGISVAPSDLITYTLRFTNTGNIGLATALLTDTVPANTTFSTAGSSAGWSCTNGAPAGTTCNLTIADLDATESDSRTFAVRVVNPVPSGTTTITNTARISGSSASANASDTTPLVTTSSLALSKSDGGITVRPGDRITYTLRYTNTGNIGLTDVVLTDTIPLDTSFEPAANPGWSCAPDNNAGSVCSFSVGTLAGGATGTATLIFTVADSVPAGTTTITNAAYISSIATGANASAGDTTPLQTTSSLALTKDDGGVSAAPGNNIAYTLRYTNTGDIGLTGLVLTDTVPLNTSFDAGASTVGWACVPDTSAGSVCSLTLADLSGGSENSALFVVTVDNPVPAGVQTISNSARISNNDTNAEASDSTPLITTASWALSKSDGGITATPGSTITYTLRYTNTGNVGLTGVVLNDTVPQHTSFNSAASSAGWSCAPDNNAGSVCSLTVGAVAGGVSGSATFAVTVINPVPAFTSSIFNTASVEDDSGTNAGANVNTPLETMPGLSLNKSDGGITVEPGDLITYTLSYTNSGDVGLSGVVLTDTVPLNTTFNQAASTSGWICAPDNNPSSVCSYTIGSLNGGVSGSADFVVTVDTPLPAGVTVISNTATVSSDSLKRSGQASAQIRGGPPPVSATASDTTPVLTTLTLSLDKRDTDVAVAPGDVITYTLRYTNTGNAGLSSVVLTDTVPLNTTFVPAQSSGDWNCQSGNTAGSACTVALNGLASGESDSRVFVVTVDNPVAADTTTITNTATIASGSTSGSGSDTTPLTTAPAISLVKSDGGITATPGDTITYTLRYTNTGDIGLSSVVLTETVPLNTTFVPAQSSAGWSCTPNGSAGSTCSLSLGTLAGGASGSHTFTVSVANPVPAGVTTISNSATIGSGSTGATADDTTPVVTTPGLALSKDDGGVSTAPSGTVVYTLRYTNTGDVGLTSVVLTETVPLNTTFAPGQSSAGWSCTPNGSAGSTCTLLVGALGGGVSSSVTFAVTVADSVATGTIITNNASIGASGGTSATASDTTPVNVAPTATATSTATSTPTTTSTPIPTTTPTATSTGGPTTTATTTATGNATVTTTPTAPPTATGSTTATTTPSTPTATSTGATATATATGGATATATGTPPSTFRAFLPLISIEPPLPTCPSPPLCSLRPPE